jgi:PTS system nitrogen regulatory IIA component
MQDVFEALIAREKLGSTGFGNGIAIPHCRLKAAPCQRPAAPGSPHRFRRHRWRAGGPAVRPAGPEAATDAHLELLRQIASMLDRKDA